MKNSILIAILILISGCSVSRREEPKYFHGMSGCFLLYHLKTQSFEKEIGDTCKERFSASSTFKVPLAVMAFDSKILSENQILKWDGKVRQMPMWNRDHDAKSWMQYSVVWFSQKLTPKLGEKKLKNYLNIMNYGNKDISTGITTAWLNKPNDLRGALAISAYEQVEFMKNLWGNKFPVSIKAMELTKKIIYKETSPNGFRLSGKTGSNSYDPDGKIQLGWFVAHLTNGAEEYIAVTNLRDSKPSEINSFGGPRAEKLMKKILTDVGLWQ